MKRQGKRPLIVILFWVIVLLSLYLLFFPQRASEAVTSGLSLCFFTVIPAVFPYLALSGIFVSLGYAERLGRRLSPLTESLFALPGCCATVILLGIFCGFPVGGRMAAMLLQRGSITKSQAARLVAFCDFCGPTYVIAVLGGRVLGSVKVGIVIFSVQTLLALLAGMVLGVGKKRDERKEPSALPRPDVRAVGEALTKAVSSSLDICGYVTFFSVFMSALSLILVSFPPVVNALVYGFFEMSGGIVRAGDTSMPLMYGTAMVLWSGVSVCMQIAAAISSDSENRIPMGLYFLVRAMLVPLGCLIVYLLSLLFDFM